MRKCPHCNNDIQDEAVFCRFCRRDVDPPLWLTSLHKCPYCAEWVERGIDACPLCGKLLGDGGLDQGEPISRPIEASEEISTPDPLQRLRQVARQQRMESRKDQEEEEVDELEIETPEPEAAEPDLTPRMMIQSEPEPEPSQRPSLLSRKLVPPVSGEFRRSRVEMLQQDDDDISLWSTEQEPKKRPSREIKMVSSNTLRRVGVAFIAILIPVALLLLALGPGKPFIEDFVNNLSSSLQSPPESQATTSAADETPFVAPTLPPLDGTDESDACVSWEEITSEMQGQSLCVEGVVRRWFSIPDMPFVAIFSEEVGTFALVDRLGPHPEVRPGTCLRATGLVEVMRGPRPFIDIQGEIELCDSE